MQNKSDLPLPETGGVTRTLHAQDYVPVGVMGVIKVLFKWGLVVVPLAVLSLVLAVTFTDEIQPEYMAEVSTLLIGPNVYLFTDFETGEVFTEEVNPLNSFGSSLATVATVEALAMSDTAVADRLEAEGLATDYVVFDQSRSPIIGIEVFDSDPELAKATADRLIEYIQEDLKIRQDAVGAPLTDRIVAQRVSGSTVGGADYGGRNRVRIAIAVVGLGLAAGAAFLLEGIQQLWKRRRNRGLSAEEFKSLFAEADGPESQKTKKSKTELAKL